MEPRNTLSADALKAWRRQMRESLIAARMALPQAEREAKSAEIVERIGALVAERPGRTVSIYWPFRGEPDLRPLVDAIEKGGGLCCLPIVRVKAEPLVFRPWRPGVAMERGIWNIPVPAEGPDVVPDLLIAPVVGYDPLNYRLGYGGGYFDRTLARIGPAAEVIGVGYGSQFIETIHPQPYDIPMTRIIAA